MSERTHRFKQGDRVVTKEFLTTEFDHGESEINALPGEVGTVLYSLAPGVYNVMFGEKVTIAIDCELEHVH